MAEIVSQTVPSIIIATSSIVASSSMFLMTLKEYVYGGPSVPLGYQTLNGTNSDVSSSPWNWPMSLSRIIFDSSIMSTEWPNP